MRLGWRLAGTLTAAAGVCLLLPGTSVPASAWQQRAPQVPTPGNNSQLSAIGCDPANHCWAVGEHGTRSGAVYSEVLRWTGRQWATASIPNPHRQSSLSAISCPAPHRCLAVGWIRKPHSHSTRAGALRWNGTGWSAASAPAGVGSLAALSCTAQGACWALDVQDGLAVHWNGHRWARPIRLPGTVDPSAIACVTATDCWMAGFYVKPHIDNLFNLIMHWNGRAWRGVPVPQPGNTNVLNDVTCVSAANCWAAGSNDTRASVRSRNEVLRWNGTRWSLVPAPKGPRANSELLGIRCLTKASCWAVGDDGATTEALRWHARHWSLVHTPDPGGAGFLFDVRCLSRTDCLAVGYSNLAPSQNLALHWNGTKWKSV